MSTEQEVQQQNNQDVVMPQPAQGSETHLVLQIPEECLNPNVAPDLKIVSTTHPTAEEIESNTRHHFIVTLYIGQKRFGVAALLTK
jgi:hypothetical protein